jgi:hypothetical protein
LFASLPVQYKYIEELFVFDMVFLSPCEETIANLVSDDEMDDIDKANEAKCKSMAHFRGENNGNASMQRRGSCGENNGNASMQRRGSCGNMKMQRRGSNGGNAMNANGRMNSFRDKLSKFKDASFRNSMRMSKSNRMDSSNDLMNTSIHLTTNPKERRVSFVKSSANVVHPIESRFDLRKKEIWWTIEELAVCRSEGQILALTDASVKRYLKIYEQAQHQVHTDRKLSSETLKELVACLSKGYLGLEAQFNTNLRIESIRNHVVSVVRYHREQSSGSCMVNLNESFSSQSSFSSNAPNNSNSDDIRRRNVRHYSAKLSTGNRNFAAAMGNAEYFASKRETGLEQSDAKLLHRQASI